MVWLAACFRFCSLWFRFCFYGVPAHRPRDWPSAWPNGSRNPDLVPVERMVKRALDASLTPTLSRDLQLELAYRKHQDPYQNLAELLRWIAENAATEKQAQLEEIIKAIGQLGYTLHLPAPALEACLHPFAGRLRRTLSQGKGEVMIVYVHPGELIETSRMMPLGFGSRVQYPLGVIVQDATGRVLSKARVLCT